jgi:hypothetical protein
MEGETMSDRPTPETDAAEMPIDRIDTVASRPSCVVISDVARKLERERDEAREQLVAERAFADQLAWTPWYIRRRNIQ